VQPVQQAVQTRKPRASTVGGLERGTDLRCDLVEEIGRLVVRVGLKIAPGTSGMYVSLKSAPPRRAGSKAQPIDGRFSVGTSLLREFDLFADHRHYARLERRNLNSTRSLDLWFVVCF